VGAAIIEQPLRTLELKVAPFFGMLRVSVEPSEATTSDQDPVALMVSLPPRESVHFEITGGAESFNVSDGLAGALPVAVNDLHVTRIGTPLIVPENVILVPFLSFPVTVVPALSDGLAAKLAALVPATKPPTAMAAMTPFLKVDLIRYLPPLSFGVVGFWS